MINSFHGQFGFLSNFYGEGSDIITVEHYYQSDKTDDDEWKKLIMEAPTPGKAKRLGNKAPMRSDWDKIKVSIMTQHVTTKFDDIELGIKLIDTFPNDLVEGNMWHDNFWGNCMCPKCIEIEGQNELGKILMYVRGKLIDARRFI